MCAAGALSHGGETQIILHDDFNRADADVVGSEWSSQGTAVLKGNAVEFTLKEEEFRPRIKRTFPLQKEGKFTVSFKMDWLRESEGTWSFHMQLGHSEALPRLLIYNTDLSKGIGVHLVWGGGELVNFQPAGSFGYLQGGKFKPLFVVNDLKNEQTVVKDPVVTIEVDVDAGTYAVTFNGKTYPDLPLDNKVPFDTIRFITNGCSKSGFSRSSIDDVKVTKGE
jgi:hypothetical protein